MLRIAFTMPEPAPDEARRIAMLLDDGWDYVHLRHPGLSQADTASILRGIPEDMAAKIVIHDHFDLARDFNIAALHLNSRNPSAPGWYTGAVTASCHAISEVMHAGPHRYVTLSPIFDSISKPGYLRAFTPAQLEQLSDSRVDVIALGGINSENISEVSCLPFAGYAVMGALAWHHDLYNFKKSYRCFSL